MTRYIFSFPSLLPDPGMLQQAEETARSLHARVLKRIGGTMLIDASPDIKARLEEALPGWQVVPQNPRSRSARLRQSED